MEKKTYEAPQIEIIELNPSIALLVGGSGHGDDWGEGGED